MDDETTLITPTRAVRIVRIWQKTHSFNLTLKHPENLPKVPPKG